MPKKLKKEGSPEVHKDLKGFDIHIDPFGEIKTSYEIDKINTFLNENVEDKKLKSQEEE